MRILVLGKGKTGSLVAEVAAERGHAVTSLASADNPSASALSQEKLQGVDAVIDFTSPQAVLENISACSRAGTNMVVGTTGWYSELGNVREIIEKSGTGFIYGANFSIGVNIFFDVAHAVGSAINHGYSLRIVERHHEQKKDSPSGTAATMQKIIADVSGTQPEITSIREGDVIGTHVMVLDSEHDTMMLVHDAKSRRGFAEGAVHASEWLAGKKGFYDFRDVFKQLK